MGIETAVLEDGPKSSPEIAFSITGTLRLPGLDASAEIPDAERERRSPGRGTGWSAALVRSPSPPSSLPFSSVSVSVSHHSPDSSTRQPQICPTGLVLGAAGSSKDPEPQPFFQDSLKRIFFLLKHEQKSRSWVRGASLVESRTAPENPRRLLAPLAGLNGVFMLPKW